jgi:hypothetical protein
MIDLRLWQADWQLPRDGFGGPSAPSPAVAPGRGLPRRLLANATYHIIVTKQDYDWRGPAYGDLLRQRPSSDAKGVTVYLSRVDSRRCTPELADLAASGHLHATLSLQKAARWDDTRAASARLGREARIRPELRTRW